MKWILAPLISSLLTLGFVGCASKPKATGLDPEGDHKQSELDKGLKALDDSRYADAAKIFDNILVKKPATEMDLVILYNSAASYEGLGNCARAGDRYREVVRSSAGKFNRIEAEALFRLSLMYECLGLDTKAVTALLDAQKRGKDLPSEVKNAEIPARLAAAYARLGNREKALQYFSQASKGLKGVVANMSGKANRELLGKTLFLMGQLNPGQRRAEGDPFNFLQSLSMQQPYLLQAMETGNAIWAGNAADDLRTAYNNFWIFKFSNLEEQRRFYIRAIQVVREFQKIRLPNPEAHISSIYAEVDRHESRLQTELAKSTPLNPLTTESEKREGLKREGRLKK